jgi:hypothetical protein
MKVQARYTRYNRLMQSNLALCVMVSAGLMLVPLVIQAVHGG